MIITNNTNYSSPSFKSKSSISGEEIAETLGVGKDEVVLREILSKIPLKMNLNNPLKSTPLRNPFKPTPEEIKADQEAIAAEKARNESNPKPTPSGQFEKTPTQDLFTKNS